jgi:hypothetical protein
MTAHTGNCHCGRVTITIAHAPDYVNDCNCTLCRKVAGLWGYYNPAEVNIVGQTAAYTRADMATPAVRTHFCERCGCTTHWSPTENIPQDRMGVNMRIFGDDAVTGSEVRYPDGLAWDEFTELSFRKPPERLP